MCVPKGPKIGEFILKIPVVVDIMSRDSKKRKIVDEVQQSNKMISVPDTLLEAINNDL